MTFYRHSMAVTIILFYVQFEWGVVGIRRYPDWHAPPICGAAPITCSCSCKQLELAAQTLGCPGGRARDRHTPNLPATWDTPVAAWSPGKFDHLVPEFGKNEFVTKIFIWK